MIITLKFKDCTELTLEEIKKLVNQDSLLGKLDIIEVFDTDTDTDTVIEIN